MTDFSIQHEKLAQALGLMKAHNLDVWLTFVRETNLSPDPALPLILNLDMTWQSAFILAKTGERIAIVGRYDVDNVKRMGGYSEIISYDEDIAPSLVKTIENLDPEFIGLNYSMNDVAADGLSHGMWQLVNRIFSVTPYRHRFVSAERLLSSLRGRKSTTEIARVRAAVKTTEAIISAVTQKLAPGQSALELHDFVLDEMKKYGVSPAWAPCPMVTVGPNAPIGHAMPSAEFITERGQIIHMDLGVVQDGYVSDLQRVWYLKGEGEDTPPAPVKEGFDFARKAILAAADKLKVGAKGYEVDSAARQHFISAGKPEYQHAVGHHIGRSVHDGATTLGPQWARYGKTSEGIVETGNIFTLELGLSVPEYGFIGLEDDVLVKDNGLEWLSTPQQEIYSV